MLGVLDRARHVRVCDSAQQQIADRQQHHPEAKDHPILTGVTEVFGDSDVYEAHPPADAKVLVWGEVLKGMKPNDPPADYKKKTVKGVEQPVNNPMQPVV